MNQVAEAFVAFFIGATLLAPVAALSARFAMKPLLQFLARRSQAHEASAALAQHARRLELLESELAALHQSIQTLQEQADFERRLSSGKAGAGDET
jgi:TolA-binding protein